MKTKRKELFAKTFILAFVLSSIAVYTKISYDNCDGKLVVGMIGWECMK